MKLYRASNHEYVAQGTSFAETLECAKAYLANPGFGGPTLWSFEVFPSPAAVLDLRGISVEAVATMLDLADPGAIGVDEWMPQSVKACDAASKLGYCWAKVDESFPAGATTWIWLGGGEEPEGEEVDGTV